MQEKEKYIIKEHSLLQKLLTFLKILILHNFKSLKTIVFLKNNTFIIFIIII